MIFCALLFALMTFAMLYGRIAAAALWVICALVPIAAFAIHKKHPHSHGTIIAIDFYAQNSRLNQQNATLKTVFFVSLLLLCIAADSALIAVVIFIFVSALTLVVGKTSPHIYISLLTAPIVFILMSGLALVFDFSHEAVGILNIPIFGSFMYVTAAAQASAFLIMIKAVGAISCLYALSLSTPLYEIIGVLRRAHLPSIVIELMYLIYRYIFILTVTFSQMKNSASARMGFVNYKTSIRTLGAICSNLLVQSFHRASQCFDAMESRGYDGKLKFIENQNRVRGGEVVLCSVSLCALVSLAAVLRYYG
ncbi:MAG: cobalt ECF transporter T component CbiQ [Oscillospiraceae bacterium]